jgi:DNA replication protein DnaC
MSTGCPLQASVNHTHPDKPSGASHWAAAILQGHKVLYRQTHILLEEVGEATLEGTRKQYMESISSVALLIIDDFGMRKLPQTAAEDLLEIVMRRYRNTAFQLPASPCGCTPVCRSRRRTV